MILDLNWYLDKLSTSSQKDGGRFFHNRAALNTKSSVTTIWTAFRYNDPEEVKILAKEPKDNSRKVLEVTHIPKSNLTLNQDKGFSWTPKGKQPQTPTKIVS